MVAHRGRDAEPCRSSSEDPLLRGIARLGMSVSPLLRRDGVAGNRERLLLSAVDLAALLRLPVGYRVARGRHRHDDRPARGFLRGRTLYLHAEHDERSLPPRKAGCPPRGAAMPRRRASRCAAARTSSRSFCRSGWSPTVCGRSPDAWTPVLVALLTLGRSRWSSGASFRARRCRRRGLPRARAPAGDNPEPTLEETRLALTAVASVLRRELP